jgi:hypothetical protein
MRLITLTLCAVTFVALSLPASADVSLADWCVNLNGDSTSVCNGGGASSANINTSGFDETLEPGTNTLGSITIKIGTGAQAAAVYMDYDVNFALFGFDQDFGDTVGALSATQSWDLDVPPNPYFEMAGNPLTPLSNTNTSGTFSTSPTPCCDVSWALEESLNVDPALYSGGTITFTVSTTAPRSGFYLEQTNGDTAETIYLSDSVNLTPLGSTPPVPEPMSIVLFGTLVAGVLFLRRRSSVNVA